MRASPPSPSRAKIVGDAVPDGRFNKNNAAPLAGRRAFSVHVLHRRRRVIFAALSKREPRGKLLLRRRYIGLNLANSIGSTRYIGNDITLALAAAACIPVTNDLTDHVVALAGNQVRALQRYIL